MKHLLGVAWYALLLVTLTIAAPLTVAGACGDPVRASAGPTRVSLTGIQHPGTGWPTAEPQMTGPAVTGRPRLRDSYPVTVAESTTDADVPTWPFAVGTIAAVAAGALWAMRRRP
ncbi:hypothetical protein I546_4836 [Mycobacterium kansasii 732]|uniref:Uncharacterized protein n=1 Tax=Mycobacterium pseudokansasii TaxID=2341080 RepID=A0A498QZE8_9MYCO|nr:hypothetical protein I546_4836 [Mycobacterium kansasii 732]KZS66091.1 hypothetical protein A4G27_13400 [Mycobacterium kansasii]MBY0389666.1 hypothetical protein [Mycobacterium pseudokansasii]VAZ86978.1 hypothetical protein LAUMK35_00056 [Mycobacterium pseudokansasii]VAZ87346.1 hypothetical protein LAUMK21_00055 [Mycobacterium pseudokansasii]